MAVLWAVAAAATADGELVAQRNLAQAALLVGDYAKAARLSEDILSTWPDDPATRLIRGLARVGLGEWGGAEEDLRYARPSFPAETSIPFNLALVEEKRGEHKEALTDLEEALAKGLNKSDAYLLKAQILDNLGRRAEARETLENYYEKKPGSRDVVLVLAQWARADGDYEKAIKYYTEALKRLRDGATVAELASTYRAVGKREEAVDLYFEAVAKGGASPDVLTEFAADYAAAGEYDAARSIYGRLVGQYPRTAAYRFGLAFVDQQLGDEDTAAAGYLKAAELKPDFAEAYYNLGAIADAREDLTGAKKYYRLFLTYAEGRTDLAATRAKVTERLAVLGGN